MVVLTKECQSNTSTSSDLDDLSYEEKRIHIFAKQMLQGRLFMGSFQEKRYVNSIGTYRDVVSLAKDEHDLIQDILAVKQRIENLYSQNHWIGITTPDMIGAPASYSIWVELPEDTMFGTYWFKIKRIKFNSRETYLRIKIMRPVNHDVYKTSNENEEVNPECTFSSHDVFTKIGEDTIYVFQNITTFKNLKETLVFLFMLLGTLIMTLFELLKYTSEFLLKFMNEFSNFMKSVAPIFQILANLVDRLFGTLCMLIAFLFKKPPPNPYARYTPSFNNAYRMTRALPAPSNKHGVIIEEIE